MGRQFDSSSSQYFLDWALDIVTPVTHAKKLKDAYRTCWIQRIDSYTIFLEFVPAVHTALQASSRTLKQTGAEMEKP